MISGHKNRKLCKFPIFVLISEQKNAKIRTRFLTECFREIAGSPAIFIFNGMKIPF